MEIDIKRYVENIAVVQRFNVRFLRFSAFPFIKIIYFQYLIQNPDIFICYSHTEIGISHLGGIYMCNVLFFLLFAHSVIVAVLTSTVRF